MPLVKSTSLLLATLFAGAAIAAEKTKPDRPAEGQASRRLRAADVFQNGRPILFEDDFRGDQLERWNFSENYQYELAAPTPERIRIVAAPGLPGGKKAVCMTVQRAPNSFRSEISLPSERGFQERWYAAKLLIPDEWVFDQERGDDIVLQWHAIPGNWRPTFPNLSISVQNDRWFIKQSFGSPQTKPTRTTVKLDEPVQRGVWVSWVVHARWSPKEDGLLQIWRDGQLVLERSGPNVYGTIGQDYTPYWKTGIYHPTWHLDDDRKRAAFETAKPIATKKVVYVTDIKIGDASMTLEKLTPR